MLDQQAQAELLGTFHVEREEHCHALTHAFLVLEKEPEPTERAGVLDAAFRAAHNLKGAARAVAMARIEELAHQLEGVLGAAKRDELDLSPALFDVLYAAVDTLGEGFAEQGGEGAAEARLQDMAERLARFQLSQRHTPPPPRAATSAASTPLPLTSAAPAELTRTGHGAGSAHPDTVRVSAAQLDLLLEHLGELVIPRLELQDGLQDLAGLRRQVEGWQRQWRQARPLVGQLEREGAFIGAQPLVRFLEANEQRLTALAAQLNALDARLAGSTDQFGALTDDLQADIKRFRTVPFGHLADILERAVRDLARSLGKEARLVFVGSETQLDRRALDQLKDPLLHLVRNALDHGIEPAAERERLSKPAIGSLVVAASQRGSSVVIEVEDDGAGVAAGVIRRVAAERGLVAESELATMHDADVLRLIFAPGFSTRLDVSELSGRGVGLDVVARNVEGLGGRVDVESTPGRGARFVVMVPLSLATTRGLLVEAGDVVYAVPIAALEHVMHPEGLGSLGGRTVLEHEGATLVVESLASLLGMRKAHAPAAADQGGPLLIIGAGAQRVGISVDRLLGEQEIVMKPLPYPVPRTRFFTSATILGSGRVVPILNVADLVREATRAVRAPVAPASQETERPPARVLIADDSLTTRSLERYILEAAGYTVELAGDGEEAFGLLRAGEFDVLVSDVDMPGLNGIELTARVRAEPMLRDLPVILVTSLESAEDRERGLRAGADAYLVKSSFDQDDLLRTLREVA